VFGVGCCVSTKFAADDITNSLELSTIAISLPLDVVAKELCPA
jgi:hypothetical protein